MRSEALSPDQYIEQLPPDRQATMRQLRLAILDNLPDGFDEVMSYGMIGYVVPHAIYPKGYHVDPSLPLPFMAIASQKNHISLYHSGLYADPGLMKWFVTEFKKVSPHKLDMGKSCVRFRKLEQIPYELVARLTAKISCQEWIRIYETQINR